MQSPSLGRALHVEQVIEAIARSEHSGRWEAVPQIVPTTRASRWTDLVNLPGESAFVTGAGTGIGAAVARELASRGAAVAIFGRRAARLEETAAAIRADGGKVLVIAGDVANAENVETAIRRAVAEFGGLHFAVNNAGVDGGTRRLAEVPVESWHETLNTNLSGVFFGLKYQIPAILASGGGAIVNVSSVFSDRGLPQHAALHRQQARRSRTHPRGRP